MCFQCFFSGFLTIRDPKVVLLTGVIDSPPSVSLTNPLVPTLFFWTGGVALGRVRPWQLFIAGRDQGNGPILWWRLFAGRSRSLVNQSEPPAWWDGKWGWGVGWGSWQLWWRNGERKKHKKRLQLKDTYEGQHFSFGIQWKRNESHHKRLKDCEWGEWSDWSHCGCEICGEEPVSGRLFPVRWWVLRGKDVEVLWNAKHTSLFEKIFKQKGNFYSITRKLLYICSSSIWELICNMG